MNEPRPGPRPPDWSAVTPRLLRPMRGPGGFRLTDIPKARRRPTRLRHPTRNSNTSWRSDPANEGSAVSYIIGAANRPRPPASIRAGRLADRSCVMTERTYGHVPGPLVVPLGELSWTF